jgi:hypothetical protein
MGNNSDGRDDIKTHARVTGLTEFSSKWWDTANIFTKKKVQMPCIYTFKICK